MLPWFCIKSKHNNVIKKFFQYTILLTLFLSLNIELIAAAELDHHAAELPFCGGENQRDLSRRLLFVTTLDGKLSALDMSDNGALKWSIETKPDYLLSSSIHRLELTNNGQLVRMIPSLSGGLYKFDGGTIEPIPVTAERLLSASFKFSDDLVISGGKETRSYGISSKNGKILYECSIHGCQNTTGGGNTNDPQSSYEIHNDNDTTTDHDPLLDEIIIVRRQTQTVRAVESRTGGERWNFSVGHHELEVLKPDNCHERPFSELDNTVLDLQLKVIVPEGIVCAVQKDKPGVILWKHKFDHPIVSAWKTTSDDNLENVDLFSYQHWPWSASEMPNNYRELSPSLYVGMFNRQLYIQESENLRKIIHSSIMSLEMDPLVIDHVRSKYLRIPWKPIAVGGAALNLIENDKLIEDENDGDTTKHRNVRDAEDISSITALSVLHASEYANGNGFYLYSPIDLIGVNNKTEHQCNKENGTSSNASSSSYDNDMDDDYPAEPETRVEYIVFSFWYSWKQILVISLATALVLNFFLTRRCPNDQREVVIVERHVEVQVPMVLPSILTNPTDDLLRERSISESSANQFTSRFSTDFETVQCLGKGGFGVVFEAKNKLDDCNYAIKRIVLPNRQESRDRVMREVKTLAHCEHQHIVRYFQAWVETPPPGWQEKEDKIWMDRNAYSHSIDIESPTSESPSSPVFVPKIRTELINKKHTDLDKWILKLNTNECLNFDDQNYKTMFVNEKTNDSDSFIQFERSKNGDDNDDDDDKTEESLHLSSKQHSKIISICDDSFEIEFKDSTIDENSNIDDDIAASKRSSMKTDTSGHNSISVTSDSFMIEFKEPSFCGGGQSMRSSKNGFRRKRMFSYTCGDTGCVDDDDNDNKIPEDTTTNNNKLVPFKKTHRRPLSLDLSSKETRANFFGGNQRMYLYIQMQLCKKQSLKDWLKLNKLDTRQTEIVPIFRQIVDAVEYVHLKGLIHRDLKPSNIFFSLDGQIKIGDFGLVTDMTPDTTPLTINGNNVDNITNDIIRHSKHTERVGTHLYMSPEQLDGKHYNYKVDIYSLGFILFELLVVFGTEMERIETLKLLRQHKFPNEFSSHFADEYKLLKLMLSQMPNERPTTIGIRSRPPLNQTDIIAQSSQWHFELPPRRRESVASINRSSSTSTGGSGSGSGCAGGTLNC